MTKDPWILKAPLGNRVGSQSPQEGGANRGLRKLCSPVWSPGGPISSAFFHSHRLTPELWPVISGLCHWSQGSPREGGWLQVSPLCMRGSTATLQGTKFYLLACWSPSAPVLSTVTALLILYCHCRISYLFFPLNWALGEQKLCLTQLCNPGASHSVGTQQVLNKSLLNEWWRASGFPAIVL